MTQANSLAPAAWSASGQQTSVEATRIRAGRYGAPVLSVGGPATIDRQHRTREVGRRWAGQ